MSAARTIGVISDTHGLLRPEAVAALEGVDGIIHAGDVNDPMILERLACVAPLLGVVRGNVDHGEWASELPFDTVVTVGARSIYMLHDLGDLELDPAAAGFDVVVHGHSHRPLNEPRGGVLFLNPGSAGPRRFSLPVTLALLRVDEEGCSARLVELLD